MYLLTVVLLVLLFLCMGLFFAVGGLVLRILYTCCIGLPVALCLGVIGILFCITIIGIPIGLLLFRVAGFVLVPFH